MLKQKFNEKRNINNLLKQLKEFEKIYANNDEIQIKKYFLESKDNLLCQEMKIDIEIEEIRKIKENEKNEKLALKLSKEKGISNNIMDINRVKLFNNKKFENIVNKDSFYCSICFIDCKIEHIVIMNCDHYFCLDCMRYFLKSNITDRNLNIKCPEPECKNKLNHDDIMLIATDDIKEIYEKYLLENTLSKDKNCKFCPKPDCGMAMYSTGENPMLICPKCNIKFCFDCNTSEWHTGITCKNYQKWKKDNSQSDNKFNEFLKRKKVKKCPKCKVNIEKNGGCNHMHCSNCDHHFQWNNIVK